MCPTTRACAMVILSVLWGHSSRARRLLCLHGIICRCNVTRCPSLGAHCTSSERQSEACPGLIGPPAVSGALVELRFHATVICSIRVSMGSIWGLLGGPGRRRDFVPERRAAQGGLVVS